MSKDRLARKAKRCPCQSADSWRALAASPKRANVLKLKPVLPKAATQSLRCSRLLLWGCHRPSWHWNGRGHVTSLVTRLMWNGVTAALGVTGCGSLKNTTDLSGLARCVGVVGNAGIKNTAPCGVHQRSGRSGLQVKGSDQDPSAT